MKKYLIGLCLVLMLATASESGHVVTNFKVAAGASAWYYPAGGSESGYTSWTAVANDYHIGHTVTPTASFTATKLSMRINDAGGTGSLQICLLNAATNDIIVGCAAVIAGNDADEWVECTISQAVSASTAYKIIGSPSINGVYFAKDTTDGLFVNTSYGTPCSASYSVVSDDGSGWAVRIGN